MKKNYVLYIPTDKKEVPDPKKEHVKGVADAIAHAIGSSTPAYAIGKHTLVTDTNVLFIGCQVSNGKIPSAVKKLLQKTRPEDVQLVVVFSVIKKGNASAQTSIKTMLDAKGIKVCEEEFACTGIKGHPTEDDIAKAKEFGAMVVSKYKS